MVDDQSAVENKCFTIKRLTEYSLKWTIENFDFSEKFGEFLLSPCFTSSSNDSLKWKLKIYPSGQSSFYRDYVSVFLWLVESEYSCGKIKAQYRFDVYDSKRKLIKSSPCICRTFSLTKTYGFHKFLRHDQLFEKTFGSPRDKTLSFVCKISVVNEGVTFTDHRDIVTEERAACPLSDDLGNIFQSRNFTDCTLVSADGKELHAHKVLLVSRSPVFRAMFEHNTTERQTNRIVISDIDFEVLEEMVRFIYTDKAPNLAIMADRLFAAADKYSLLKLRSTCEHHMATHVTADNACRYFALADLHNSAGLRVRAAEYLKTHAHDVLKWRDWANMPTTCQITMTELLLKMMILEKS